MESHINLSVRDVDYLIAIYKLGGRKGKPVRLKELAAMLGVAKPTASLMVKRLTRDGFVIKSKDGLRLSDIGLELCLRIVWRHGVLELVLTRLGIPLDKACKLAREIELSIPDDVIKIMWNNIGRPVECPHGHDVVSGPATRCPDTCRPVRSG